MRILYISSGNICGGATIALFNLIKGVMAKGHKVKVLTPRGQGEFLSMLKSINCDFKQVDIPLTIYPTNRNPIKFIILLVLFLFKIKKCRYTIKEEIESFAPDIVHTNVGPLDIAVNTCIKMNIPHFWHQREYQNLDFGMHFFPSIKKFTRLTRKKGNYNIVITRGLFQYRKFREGIDRVIYDGVFDGNVIPEICDKKEEYILFVGRIEQGKMPDEVISVFINFHQKYPNMKLFLAGGYDIHNTYYQKCKKIIEENELNNSVQFLGVRNDIYSLMSKATMLIVPSKFEGFGFITVEAMLNGCVVIGRNTAGTKEQFDIGLESSGEEIALRYTTKSELYNNMLYVMSNDMSEMCNRAKKVVVNHYSIQQYVDNVIEFYLDVLKDRYNEIKK